MADGSHGAGGHETPSSNEQSVQNIISPVVGALSETVTHFMSDIAQTALNSTVETGKDLAVAAGAGGSQPNKGGGGGGVHAAPKH